VFGDHSRVAVKKMAPDAESRFCSPPLVRAVVEARSLSERTMREWALTGLEEPVTAIIAELVANAVLHAGTDLTLRLSCANSRIRIEVDDQDPRPPVMAEPAGLQEGGRGMVIVALYSTAWGFVPRLGGKTVWAEIDLASTPLPWRPDSS
jgi:hypothetical protein